MFQLNIKVTDENDNAPRFSTTDYVFQKLESDANPRVGQVYATDQDEALNAQIRFSILSGAEGDSSSLGSTSQHS